MGERTGKQNLRRSEKSLPTGDGLTLIGFGCSACDRWFKSADKYEFYEAMAQRGHHNFTNHRGDPNWPPHITFVYTDSRSTEPPQPKSVRNRFAK